MAYRTKLHNYVQRAFTLLKDIPVVATFTINASIRDPNDPLRVITSEESYVITSMVKIGYKQKFNEPPATVPKDTIMFPALDVPRLDNYTTVVLSDEPDVTWKIVPPIVRDDFLYEVTIAKESVK